MFDLLIGVLLAVPGLVFAWWIMSLPPEPGMMTARATRRANRQLQEIYDYVKPVKSDPDFERALDAELFALVPQEQQVFGAHFVDWLGAANDVLSNDSRPGDETLDVLDVPVAHNAWFDRMLGEAGLKAS